MPDYKIMYEKLFNQVTDSIVSIEAELSRLRLAQLQTEEIYIETAECDNESS
ncbi:MAG: hypothetical protein WC900_08715 [Oscillospiraceae bacterium]|jgi:hypothetical protein